MIVENQHSFGQLLTDKYKIDMEQTGQENLDPCKLNPLPQNL